MTTRRGDRLRCGLLGPDVYARRARCRPTPGTGGSARPSGKSLGATLEARIRRCRRRCSMLRLRPSAERHRAVADEYRRLGITDAAFDHLSAATRLDPADAARVRRAGANLARLGLPAARHGRRARAVFFAPRSAAAHNTRGTLLAAAGSDRGGATRVRNGARARSRRAPSRAPTCVGSIGCRTSPCGR